MKRLSFIILLCFLATILQAQNKKNTIRPPRPKVGVVLGGGGAKGASHIGVLKYIEEMGIPIDYVAGTSMGSIIGGLYAMGYEPDEMNHLIANIDWNEYIGNKINRNVMSEEFRQRSSTSVLNIPFGRDGRFPKDTNGGLISQLPSAYVNNSSLVNLFNDLCVGYQEDMDFNDMPIPFACVATNLITGQEVVLRSGNVSEAMRASMAIPGVFAPVVMGDYVLVDGGLVNNFPADVLREMGADIIIGVEITKEKQFTAADLKSLPQVMARLLTNSTSAKREENRNLCNLYIVPDVTGYGMLSFNAAAIDTLVERGYKKAHEYHDQLLAIKQGIEQAVGHPVGKELHAPRAKNLDNESVMIRSIEISGVDGMQNRWLIRKGGLKVGQCYSKAEIEHAVNVYRGTACFDDIIYSLKESDSVHDQSDQLSDAYDLTIKTNPAQPHVMGLGLRYDTEEGAALLFNFGFNEKKFSGSKFKASFKLSYNPRVNLTYTYSRSSLANFNLAYDYRNEHFRTTNLFADRLINLHYRQQKLSACVSQFHLLNLSTIVGASFMSTTFDFASMEGGFLDSIWLVSNRFLAPFINIKYDNLDNSYFAKHGLYVSLNSHYYWDYKNRENNNFDLGYAIQYYITPKDGRWTIIPQVYGRYFLNETYLYNLRNKCGGEIEGRHFENQLPFIGISYLETFGTEPDLITVTRCDLRYNFYGKHYLTGMYNALWRPAAYVFHGAGLKYSYNSVIGPVSLTVQWSNLYESKFSAYFSFGYTF